MAETNGTRFEFSLMHILYLANLVAVFLLSQVPSRFDVFEGMKSAKQKYEDYMKNYRIRKGGEGSKAMRQALKKSNLSFFRN